MRDGVYDDSAAVTHMSSDSDTVENLAWFFQESWAQVVEVLFGMGLLWNQLGWWCLTPLVLVVCKFHLKVPKPLGTTLIFTLTVLSQVAKWIGSKVGAKSAAYQKAKQQRIALTTSMIDYIKNIKMVRPSQPSR
jgi:ATP-binding cassette subfamily C (CFTR/MRP) protein 1